MSNHYINEILSHVALKDYDQGSGKGPFIESNLDNEESEESEDDIIEEDVMEMEDIIMDENILGRGDILRGGE